MLRILAVAIMALVGALTFLLTSFASGAMAPGYTRNSAASGGGATYATTASVADRPRSVTRQRRVSDRSAWLAPGWYVPARNRMQAIYVPPF